MQTANNKQDDGRKFTIEDIQKLTITHKSDIKPLEAVIKIDGRTCCTKGGLSMITGKRGSGKSTILRIAITASLMDSIPNWYDTLLMEVTPANGKPVFYINTELPDATVKKLHDQILDDLGLKETPTNLHFVDALFLSIEDRGRVISDIIHHYPDTHLLFIDGGADTVGSVNDEVASIKAVEELLQLAAKYKTTIVNVVHENTGNGQSRGHYGQHCERKSELVLSVSFDSTNSIFEIKGKKIRHASPFKDIRFAYATDGSGRIQRVSADTTEKIKDNAKKDSLLSLAHTCFKSQKRYPRAELTKLIADITETSLKTGQTRLNDMLTANYVTIDDKRHVVCLLEIPDFNPQMSIAV